MILRVMPPPLIRFALPLVLIWLWSLKRGGAPERVATSSLLAAEVASFVASFGAGRFLSPDTRTAIIDVALLLVLIPLALRANRLWPIFLLATHIITVLSHFDMVMNTRFRSWGYAIMQIAPAYLGLALVAAGIWRHSRRVARTGAEPSWRHRSSPRSGTTMPPLQPRS